jgi:hypothetical protein
MSFLYPTFLWALAALSIPIIIHLFNFRRTRQIYFSNTRFLKQVKEATTARRRLKHYLILLSRLLFLAFLVMAFAQPIIPAREQLGNNRNITIYVDNSLSMSGQLPDKTRGLDASLQFTRNIVDLFPPETRYKLITNDFAPFSNSYKTKAEVGDLLTEIRLSPISRTMAEIKERIRSAETNGEHEVFWISDFQKSTLGMVVPQPADSTYRWHLVPLNFEIAANVFVDSAYLENPFAAGGEKNVLHVQIRNDGKQDVDGLNLKLTINDLQAATVAINIPQGGITETGFDLTTGLEGLNKAKISFNDYPINFDNEFYMALNFTHKMNVIEIKDVNERTSVERVFGNRKIFTYQGFPVGNFNYALLNQANLVVVNGLNTIDPSLSLALRRYLDNYGTVLFIPGTAPDIASYKNLLQLPVLANTENKAPGELDRPDFNNPFFENVFEEKSAALTMPKADKTLDWGGDRSAILHFKNNEPFLSMFSQQGKLYLMGCPLASDYTDFFNNALFVPVMYRIAASGRKDNIPLYYNLHENFIALRVDSMRGEEPLKLVGEEEVVPSQRKVGEHIFLDLPKFSIKQGFYNVLARDTVGLVAFNIDKAESYMEQYTGEEVKNLLGNGNNITLFNATSTDAFSNEIKARYLGTPLWKYAVMLALLFLLIEILLIRFLK